MVKISKNILIPVAGLIIFAGIAAAAYFNVFKIPEKYLPAKNLSADAAAKKAIEFVNKNMLSEGAVATYKEAKEENGLYAFKLTVQEKDYNAYVTKNGKLLFADGIPQAIPLDTPLGGATEPAEVAKSDKPDVKLFIMSYCPYGLQAQKMYLPVYDLLKDKADIGVYFVNYAMHDKMELDENLRQYCIQKEQKDKYSAYLKCFATTVPTAADGTGAHAKCLSAAGVDQGKLSVCVTAADKEFKVTANFNDKSTWVSGTYPKFDVHADLNTKYNVQGSPTVIVNDQDVSESLAVRSPEAFKQVICSAFNNQPQECQTALSSDQVSPSFGDGTASNAAAGGSCN